MKRIIIVLVLIMFICGCEWGKEDPPMPTTRIDEYTFKIKEIL